MSDDNDIPITVVSQGEGYMIVEGLPPRPTPEQLKEQLAKEMETYPPEVREKLKARYSKRMVRPEYFGHIVYWAAQCLLCGKLGPVVSRTGTDIHDVRAGMNADEMAILHGWGVAHHHRWVTRRLVCPSCQESPHADLED